jgi:hypothetical protein
LLAEETLTLKYFTQSFLKRHGGLIPFLSCGSLWTEAPRRVIAFVLKRPMKVLVQRADTTEYAAPSGGWTRSVELAINFQKGEKADEFCAQQVTVPLRIVIKFETEQRPDIVLPPTRRSSPSQPPSETG